MDLSILPPPPPSELLHADPALMLPPTTHAPVDTVGAAASPEPITVAGAALLLEPEFPMVADLASEPVVVPDLAELAAPEPDPHPEGADAPSAHGVVDAYPRSDDLLLTPRLRWGIRGYRPRDVHLALDAMRRRIVTMRADLERAQAAQKQADAIVTKARRTAAEMLADANLEANRLVSDARRGADQERADTHRQCQKAARRGISAAFEMAGMLGYKDTHDERLDEQSEQDAFDAFFTGDDDSSDRDWMATG